MPAAMKDMVVRDASHVAEIAGEVDFVFCAVDMPKAEIKALEEAYAKAECPVLSLIHILNQRGHIAARFIKIQCKIARSFIISDHSAAVLGEHANQQAAFYVAFTVHTPLGRRRSFAPDIHDLRNTLRRKLQRFFHHGGIPMNGGEIRGIQPFGIQLQWTIGGIGVGYYLSRAGAVALNGSEKLDIDG